MELSDYKPTCALDFELIVDRWIDDNKNNKDLGRSFSKEDYLKELMLECFKIGYKAGQMPINTPINLKRIASEQVTIRTKTRV